MRFVERDGVEPPKWFASKEARSKRRELLEFFQQEEKNLNQTRTNISESFTDNGDPMRGEVSFALQKLFDGKCAFCESELSVEFLVHRFRPSSSASPVTDTRTAHLYYGWLAEAWQNLYPICLNCRPEDLHYFPVTSNIRTELPDPNVLADFAERDDGRWPNFPLDENPVLVDPCYDRKLWRHFRVLPHGRIVGRDRRGRITIEHFNLNRGDLQDARRTTFEVGRHEVVDFLRDPQRRDVKRLIDSKSFPHFGSWRIMLREILGTALGKAKPSDNLESALKQLGKTGDALNRFESGVVELEKIESQWYADDAIDPEEQILAGISPSTNIGDLPTKVTIKNFKSIESLALQFPPRQKEEKDQTPSLLILGENAAGKSTILEAIALTLMGPTIRRALTELEPKKMVLDPKFLGGTAAPYSKAEITVSYGTGQDTILTINRELGSKDAGFEDSGLVSSIPLFAYGAFRQYLKTERRNVRHRHVRSLFESDELLSNPEKWLVRLSESDFEMVARALRDVFAIDKGFDVLERDNNRVFIVSTVGNDPSGAKTRTPLSIVSSGFRSILAMLCDIMQGLMNKQLNPSFETLDTERGLVLIDEIEAHLHPKWKVSIMAGLRKALPGVCFVATSHDPLCLRGMDKHEVLVLERIEETSDTGLPVYTQALVDLPDNKNWTIQQLLTADFFQLQSTQSEDDRKKQASVEDKLAKGIKPENDAEVREYLSEISDSLPIGDTEVHRLVHEAIAWFLAARQQRTKTQLQVLRKKTKERILSAMQGV